MLVRRSMGSVSKTIGNQLVGIKVEIVITDNKPIFSCAGSVHAAVGRIIFLKVIYLMLCMVSQGKGESVGPMWLRLKKSEYGSD